MKTGPLTRDELMLVWAAACDIGYREPLQDAGDGFGLEVYSQHAAQLERVSKAIDKSTQALYILPHSGQTDEPASGGKKANVAITVTRSINLQRPLVITAGSLTIVEETTDRSPTGPVVTQTGRRFITTADIVFNPGETGPFTVNAIAERIGTGYNNPRPGTLSRSVQVGANFTRPRASIVAPDLVNATTLIPARGQIVSANEADTFIPEHIGRSVIFTAGANVGLLAHLIAYLAPPNVANGIGSIVAFDVVQAVAGTVVGTFVTGEVVNLAAGKGRLYAVRGGRMTFRLLTGTAPAVGGVMTGATSGATLTVTAILDSSSYAVETGGATWRVLDWEADWGLTITNATSPSGGKHALLDMLGDERALARASNESDASYSARVSTLADVVTPNALKRAMSRALGTIPWTWREIGSIDLRGSFYDDTLDKDAYDGEVYLITGTTLDTFLFQEQAVLEDSSFNLAARGFVGNVVGALLTFVVRPGSRPIAGGTYRVRGLTTGAMFSASNVFVPSSVTDRRFRRYFDYEQFRGYFIGEVARLGLGEFGFAWDDSVNTSAGFNAFDASSRSFDGYPRDNRKVYLSAYAALNQARAGGVGFHLEMKPTTAPSISRTTGDTFGSKYSDVTMEAPVVIKSSGLSTVTGAAGVKFGTTNAISYTVDSDDQITAIPPGHVAGVVAVTVVSATRTITVGSYEYWSPCTLTPRGFWDGSPINTSAIPANRWSFYGWAGATNSIYGSYGPNNPVAAPGAGYFLSDGNDGDPLNSGRFGLRMSNALHGPTTLGGYPGIIANAPDPDARGYATFVRSHADGLYFNNGGWSINDWVGIGACTVAMVIDINAAVQAQTDDLKANALMNDSNMMFGVMLGGAAGNEAIFIYFDGTAVRKVRSVLPVSSGRLVLIVRRTSSGVLQLTFDGSTWVTGDTCTGALTGYGFAVFGTNVLNPTAGSFDGRLRTLMTMSSDIADADAKRFVAWAAARHA